jgi:hypothetical protein
MSALASLAVGNDGLADLGVPIALRHSTTFHLSRSSASPWNVFWRDSRGQYSRLLLCPSSKGYLSTQFACSILVWVNGKMTTSVGLKCE